MATATPGGSRVPKLVPKNYYKAVSRKYRGDDAEKRKEKWHHHLQKCTDRHLEWCEVVLYGASNIARRDEDKWSSWFGRKVLNFAFGGDQIGQLLYRIMGGCIPKYPVGNRKYTYVLSRYPKGIYGTYLKVLRRYWCNE